MERDNKNYNILIIEDNPGDFALTEDFLMEHFKSTAITHAWDFREANEILSRGINAFDVVLLDLSLPDKRGESLIVEINDLCGEAPLIVLTDFSDFSFGLKSLSLGVADYVLKEELTALALYKSIIYSMERKRSTQALIESEKKYSELFQLSPQPMWVLDPVSLAFLKINKAAISHYGYSLSEFLSMTLKDIYLSSADETSEHGSETILERQLYNTGSCRLRKKNGEWLYVEIQINKLQFKGNPSLLFLANDVTERITYIKEIEKQNRTFKEISWIQSHVVRAPLARLMGLLYLFQESNDSGEKSRIVDYLLCSANELDTTIRAITDKIANNNDEEDKRCVPLTYSSPA